MTPTSSFARQMALLSFLGYRRLAMSELLPYLQGERDGKVVGWPRGKTSSTFTGKTRK